MERVIWLWLAIDCRGTDSEASQMRREEHVCVDWQEGRRLYRLCACCCMRLFHDPNPWWQDRWLQISTSLRHYPGREERLR